MQTDTSNILIGQAVIETKLASLSAQMLENKVRNEEQIDALVSRLDERHESLTERLAERHRHREKFEEGVMECLEDIRESLKPIEKRISELEATKGKVVAAGATLSGLTVTLAGVAAWLMEHVPAWFAPIVLTAFFY